MRIYCNRDYEYSLDKYIGKDVWLNVEYGSLNRHRYWIKILSKSGKFYTIQRYEGSNNPATTRKYYIEDIIFDNEVLTSEELLQVDNY